MTRSSSIGPSSGWRAALLDPSLFTLPYDISLATGLVDAGATVAVIGRQLRPQERLGTPNFDLLPHYYRVAESRQMRTMAKLSSVVKGLEHGVNNLRLPRALDAWRADVMHVHWTPIPFFDWVALRAARRRRPLIMTIHNSVPFHGNATWFQKAGYDRLLHLSDHFIGHTRQTLDYLVGEGISTDKISVIPHGLLPFGGPGSPLTPEAPADDGICRILQFGEIKPYKGIDILFDAIGLLPDDLKSRVRVTIAGRARMDLTPLYEQIDRLGLGSLVTWDLRFIPDTDIPGLFAACDLLSLPYKHIDGSGVLSLAINSSRPVLASDLGGFRETLGPISPDFLAKPDATSFSAGLTRLIADPVHRRALADRLADPTAHGIPTWKEIGIQTLDAYARAQTSWQASL